jgi:hypothetical protein
MKLNNRLKKQARLKYNTFKIADVEIRELNKKKLLDIKPKNDPDSEVSNININQIYNDQSSSDDEESVNRRATPNPWEVHLNRKKLKKAIENNFHQNEKAKSALSYLNYDI